MNNGPFYNGAVDNATGCGVLLELACPAGTAGRSELAALGKELTLHIASAKPIAVSIDEVPPDVVEEISEIPGSELIAQAVQWRRRRSSLARLRTVIESPQSTERDIHKELKQQTWIFGGRYVKEIARRRLTTTDEIDIPLLRGDGSLHVLELKKAVIPNLVEPLRSHYAVGTEVHRAVSQAVNYLRSLDENRALILAEHGIECRRTFATVLIGHPKFIDHAHDPAEVAATLRTYNAALSRIETASELGAAHAADLGRETKVSVFLYLVPSLHMRSFLLHAFRRLTRPLYVALTAISVPIGFVVSHTVMAIVFFGLLLPLGIAFRLMRRDLLSRTPDAARRSYWEPRPPRSDVRRYYRQF